MGGMVERVARAIEPLAFDERHFAAMADVRTQPGDFEDGQERARRKARAAITAMREPTVDMKRAFASVGRYQGDETGMNWFLGAWGQAIDEALK
jgi:hypothetical protein